MPPRAWNICTAVSRLLCNCDLKSLNLLVRAHPRYIKHLQTFTLTHAPTHLYVYNNAFVNMHAQTRTHAFVHAHAPSRMPHAFAFIHTRMHPCTHAHTHPRTHTHICLHFKFHFSHMLLCSGGQGVEHRGGGLWPQ